MLLTQGSTSHELLYVFSPIKREYTFYNKGEIVNQSFISNLSGNTLSERNMLYAQHINLEIPNERAWRNHELSATDWMVIPDATYNKLPLKDSVELAEILQYRGELRAYDLTVSDRPKRPTWFKD